MAEAEAGMIAGLPAPLALRDDHPFVGRDRELGLLHQRWLAVDAGRPQLVALAGEPGVGKTQLALRFAHAVHASGATVLFGRCDEEPLERYQPFVEAMRDALAQQPVDVLAALPRDVAPIARLLPELASRLPAQDERAVSDAETQRYRLFEAVTTLLRFLAERSPVVLLLDDIHWADRPTLLLLRHLLRPSAPVRLLVVATYRDTDVPRDHPLGELIADLRRDESVMHRVDVRGLDDDAVLALLEQLAGHELPDLERTLVRELRRITGGNSFFIRETVRHLVEIGALVQHEDGRWAPDLTIAQRGIPEGVREVVLRRVGRLSAGAQRTLVHAAVIGREFDIELLRAITGTDEGELVNQLDEALLAQLVLEARGTVERFTFAHALVRETLYQTVSMSRRVRLHRAVGEALEAAAGTARLAELAHHFSEAPDVEGRTKALDYARRAGDEAMQLLAYEEAGAAYRRALHVLDRLDAGDDRTRAELLLALGNSQSMASDRPAARNTFRRVCDLARPSGAASAVLVEAALGFAGMFGDPGEPDAETVRLLEEALASEPDDVAVRARLLTRLAIELLYSPDEHRRSMVLFDEAVTAAEQSGDGAAVALSRWNRRLLLGRPASPAERTALGEDTLRLALEIGDTASMLSAYGWLLVDHLEAGRTADARNDIDAYGALVQQLRMPYRRGFPTLWRSTLALLEGRVDDAEALSHESLTVAGDDSAGVEVDPMFFTNWSGQLFALRSLGGRLGELRESVEMVVASKPGLLAWRAALAYLYDAIGERERAEAIYRDIVTPPLSTLPVDGLWLFTTCLLAELAVQFDDTEHMADLEQLLRPCADRTVIVAYAAFSFGPVALRLGMLATKLGEHQRAERDLREAIELSRASGAWPWVASAELALAALYEVRHQPGDRERASALREAVGEAARENGWSGLLTRAQSTPPASPARYAPVSPW